VKHRTDLLFAPMLWAAAITSPSVLASPAPVQPSLPVKSSPVVLAGLPVGSSLADELVSVRKKIDLLQQELVVGLSAQKNPQAQIKRAQQLVHLRRRQKELGERKVRSLEMTLDELNTRKMTVRDKITTQQKAVLKLMAAIEVSERDGAISSGGMSLPSGKGNIRFTLPEQERLEAPRRKVLAHLVDHGVKEIEALRIDLADLGQLEGRIQEEKQQIAYLMDDLKEQESVLKLNQQVQADLLEKKKTSRLGQLQNYQKLKGAESQVEQLMSEFDARLELKSAVEAERTVAKEIREGGFSRLKGKLPFPVTGGRVVSLFGRSLDTHSGLQVFRKGVDIAAQGNQAVKAISGGKVAYSGELPNYGRVVIIDHGEHFYSLFGHLGAVSKKSNEWVAAGDLVGRTDNAGTPLYFEIRSRNVAVNPLQWVLN
jgi:septal ring factor EnvC (AmiA/AmiB activator)